jgi:hypothetical protein
MLYKLHGWRFIICACYSSENVLEQGAEENIWTEERRSDGRWRKLRNKKLRDLYSSPSIIRMIKSRRMRWAGHVARIGDKRNAYRILLGKSEGKRLLGRTRRRWVDNIKMDCFDQAQDRDQWGLL